MTTQFKTTDTTAQLAATHHIPMEGQYNLLQILVIWVLAAGPMAILGWIVAPALEPLLNVADPLRTGTARTICLTIGLMWQFVLSLIIVYLERGNLRISTIKERLLLTKPEDPRTSKKGGKVWLWFIPFFLLLGLIQVLFGALDPYLQKIPGLTVNKRFDASSALSDPETQKLLVGAWWFFGLFVLLLIFNTVLGEEFLFRGILLPKMEGVFKKYDWVANGILMGAYHWHQPWSIPSAIISSVFVFSLASKRYKSTWMGIALHSVQSVIFIFLIFGIVLGVA